MYDFKGLDKIEFREIALCMKEAFSDYYVKMDLDEDQLYNRFNNENVRYELSYGAFFEGKLIAVLLNAVGTYNGERIAFDAVTGVIPEHRRKGLSSQLMSYCAEALRKEKISSYVLEVIQANAPAISAYRKMGLAVTKQYACFRGNAECKAASDEKDNDAPVKQFPLETLKELELFAPSFENRTEIIQSFADQYHVLYCGEMEDCKAFIIYDRHSGQIKQLGRKSGAIHELEQLLSRLNTRYTDIRIHNIDFGDRQLIESLERLGFNHFCDQYEMEMIL